MAIYLTGAAVYTARGEFIDGGVVVIAGGKLSAVGPAAGKGFVRVPRTAKRAELRLLSDACEQWRSSPVAPPGKARRPQVPKDAPGVADDIVIDCAGLRIYPGMVDPHTHLAVFEDGAGPVSGHGNEATSPVTAGLDIIDSIYPEDLAIPDAQAAGVTTVCILPGSANVIGGMTAVCKVHGRTVDEMLLLRRQGLKMANGENPYRLYGSKGVAPATRFGVAGMARDAFDEARLYMDKRAAWQKKSATERGKEPLRRDRKLENIAGALAGEYPVRFHAHRTDDIYTALRLSQEFGFKLILEHGTEGYKLADAIAAAGVPVTLGPTLTARVKYELRGRSTETAGVLHRAGVLFAFQTDHPIIPIRFLPLQAAVAVKDGLPESAAVDALTINAARILGLDRQLGSLAAGKDADLFLTDNDLLDPRHHVLATFIDGFCVFAA